MDFWVVVVLVLVGIVVGVINTFAGAGATISIALYSLLGMDLGVANGTNRISVVFQGVAMSGEFYRQKRLDVKLGLKLSIPTVIGAIVGSEVVGYLSNALFAIFLAVVLLLILLMLLFDPTKALVGRGEVSRPTWAHYVVLLFVGFYGGSFHLGVGYLFLTFFIMGLGYDLLSANALKGFVVLIYTLFSLVIFAINGDVEWSYGLVHGVGNLIGAYFAAHYARFIPLGALRYALIVFVLLTISYIFIFKIL